MRIALVSFEFPPAVAIGGIGAYAWEAAVMLAAAGHSVEVFAAGKPGQEPAEDHGVKVHRFDVPNRAALREAMVPVFTARHREAAFDLLETPEIGAEGRGATLAHPEVARVVKLHTPAYLVNELGWEAPGFAAQARFVLGGLRRGKLNFLRKPPYQRASDVEFQGACEADEIAAPCRSIGEKVGRDWSLDPAKISVYPYPFRPKNELLELPVPKRATTIGFLGRMEPRKGVIELAHALPGILAQAPSAKFRFLGPSWPYRKSDMEQWIRRQHPKEMHAVTFVGAVGRERLAEELSLCDIIVLPSRWENFPFACWESMASGRAVIGSDAGGMSDGIEPGESGLLVPPRSPQAIVEAVLSLFDKTDEVARLGANGRRRVCDYLHPDRILPLQMASYHRAMERATTRHA